MKDLITILQGFINPNFTTILFVEAQDNFEDLAENIENSEEISFDPNYWSFMQFLRANNITTKEQINTISQLL